ncbi:PREDICTED: Golgi to ER traffic protein 4 homolog [Dufourea novaeangliae]|uniref:Golgi to ER traffic protein 4 like protein n=1 Tax=Dufourea novaeangliae TaxID=178035 RepID=A0A154PPY3_DUFNO|nr:PREDICTED: Golgi to ER traffic protein 4 homolog [Dufourea novaeangliae]KZC13777.1 Golgi to ER traffic protein 4 like protein [Dufourea novaeangliae]
MASRYSHGVQRVLAKLEASINSGNYYEAHQMYRTLYFRYLGQKKYSELLDLLYNGSTILLQHEQYASGADLGILFVNVLTQSGTEPSQNYFEKIRSLFSLMNPSSPERDTFVQSALRWSIKNTEYKTGHPDLHQKVAQVFWREKNYIMARQHFIHSRDGSGCAAMLVELHEQRGYTNEIDLFIAQAVLQYLCLKNKATAQEVFNSYISRHPKINSDPPYLLPLLNFLFFLLKTIDGGKLAVFTVLCEQYQISLNRDPCYRQYLDKIGQLFFDIPSPRPRIQGVFGSLLQSFFNDLEDEDSDDEHRNTASTSHTAQELD